MNREILKNRSAWLLAGLVVVGLGVYVWANWEPAIQAPARARAPGAPSIESIPGGPQTPEYDRLQKLADHRRADRAREIGGSAVPTPPRLDPLATESPSVSTPTPTVNPRTAAPVSPPGAAPPDDSAQRAHELARAMRDQMKGLITYRERFEPTPTRMVVFEDLRGQREQAEQQKYAAQWRDESRKERLRDRHGLLQPGDILYAVLQTAIHSDEPGPVRAKIVGERFKDSILLGGLSPFPPIVGSRPERVRVKFDHLTTPERVTYPIDAYAIDTETARTALATGVDYHAMERGGSLIAASFLEGYGQAVRASHSITTVGPLGNVVSVPQDDIDHEDIVREAVGTVGERLGDAVGDNFRRPNTITVASGTGIGVLIVAPTAGETSPEEAPARPVRTAYSRVPPRTTRDPAGVTGAPPALTPAPATVPSTRPLRNALE
jgi:type IV secretory pathway VirB10-like protein